MTVSGAWVILAICFIGGAVRLTVGWTRRYWLEVQRDGQLVLEMQRRRRSLEDSWNQSEPIT